MDEKESDYTCTLDAVGAKRARVELGEIETDRSNAVQSLRDWVLQQSDWLQCPTDTQFLLGFLRHRKFSQKAAKERLVKYWRSRMAHPEWFTDVDVRKEKIIQQISLGIVLPLPKRDQDGCKIILIRMGRMDPKQPKVLENQLGVNCAIFDHLLRDDMNQVCGIKIFHDFTDVTVEHLTKLADGGFKKIADVFMNSYPLRVRSINYYNVGTLFDLLFTIIKQVMSKKLRDRVSTHKYLTTMYEKISQQAMPLEYLPDDYDGPHAGSVDSILQSFIDEIKGDRSRDYIMKLSNGGYFCNISKMPDGAVPVESFRALQV